MDLLSADLLLGDLARADFSLALFAVPITSGGCTRPMDKPLIIPNRKTSFSFSNGAGGSEHDQR